jgi:hypothetical protein
MKSNLNDEINKPISYLAIKNNLSKKESVYVAKDDINLLNVKSFETDF